MNFSVLLSLGSSSSESYDFRFEKGDTDEAVGVQEEVELEEVIQVIDYEEEEEDQTEEEDEMNEVERESEEENQMDQMEEVAQESPSSSTMPADSNAEVPLESYPTYLSGPLTLQSSKFPLLCPVSLWRKHTFFFKCITVSVVLDF